MSGDYETVFEESEADLIPFQNQENLDSVRALIRFLEDYDFSGLTQDLLGNIYDRLISLRRGMQTASTTHRYQWWI
ncbi:hypothetical protein [Thermogymnomonas acidicola]|uniref:hypothetical protein n=1 Tax=Thermogymnomonas acidicola TaxID=399579 RepID=UPI00094646B4|nr:hypothetical protein [Thermogymnomonas acidicola]